MIYSRPELSGINFLHFKDILLADFGIDISYFALLSILKMKDSKAPKRKKSGTAPTNAKENPIPGSLYRSMPLLTNDLAAESDIPFMGR